MIVCSVVVFSKFFIYGAELVGVSDKICGESLMVALVEVAAESFHFCQLFIRMQHTNSFRGL